MQKDLFGISVTKTNRCLIILFERRELLNSFSNPRIEFHVAFADKNTCRHICYGQVEAG